MNYAYAKSTLDGSRESVFVENTLQNFKYLFGNKLRLTNSERLDSLGLIKRAYKHLQDEKSLDFKSLHALVNENVIKSYDLPSDCVEFIHLNIKELLDLEANPETFKFKKDIILEHIEFLNNNGKSFMPGAENYVALVQADGDGIGKAIKQIKNKEQYINFSKALSEFSNKAREIIIKNEGFPIYLGGDDLLFSLKVSKTYICCEELNKLFCEKLKDFSPDGSPLSVSFGISIQHLDTPFKLMRNMAKQAESFAKKGFPKNWVDEDEKNAIAFNFSDANGSDGTDDGLLRIGFKKDVSPKYFLQQIVSFFSAANKSLPYAIRDDFRHTYKSAPKLYDEKNLESFLQKKCVGENSTQLKDLILERYKHLSQKALAPKNTENVINQLTGELILARRLAEYKVQI